MKLKRIRFKRNFYLLFSTLLLLFLLVACGGQPSNDSVSGSGEVRFSAVYHDPSSHQPSRETELDCAGEGS